MAMEKEEADIQAQETYNDYKNERVNNFIYKKIDRLSILMKPLIEEIIVEPERRLVRKRQKRHRN